jgi:hypothetical protein
MVRRMRIGVAAAVLVAVVAGCGGGAERTRVRAVTERFYAAVRSGDGRAACAALTADTRTELASQEGKPCARAIGSLDLHPAAVTRVQVYITNAKADLAGGETAFLSREAGGWRLSAIGCEPQGGKPADRPYDCEAQA